MIDQIQDLCGFLFKTYWLFVLLSKCRWLLQIWMKISFLIYLRNILLGLVRLDTD